MRLSAKVKLSSKSILGSIPDLATTLKKLPLSLFDPIESKKYNSDNSAFPPSNSSCSLSIHSLHRTKHDEQVCFFHEYSLIKYCVVFMLYYVLLEFFSKRIASKAHIQM